MIQYTNPQVEVVRISTRTHTLTDNAGFDTNTYSVADWSELESAGAVFLPAAGLRNGGNSRGYYWSSSPDMIKADLTYNLFFSSGIGIDPGNSFQRFNACCVRLVTEVY